MVNLFDIVRQAQGGAGMENLSRQFGLTAADTQRAVEALLPAFMLGFQQSARNPNSFVRILEMMSSGRYAPFFDLGFGSATGLPGGQQILEGLFGSPDAARQIAGYASSLTGIGANVLQAMLPSIAAMLMGGLFRFATVEGMADFLRGWADWLQRLAPPEARRPSPVATMASPFGLWADLSARMMAGTPPQPPPQPDDPWSSFMRALTERPGPKPPPAPPSQPDPFGALEQMVQAGREVQAQQLADLQAVIDSFWTAVPSARRP